LILVAQIGDRLLVDDPIVNPILTTEKITGCVGLETGADLDAELFGRVAGVLKSSIRFYKAVERNVFPSSISRIADHLPQSGCRSRSGAGSVTFRFQVSGCVLVAPALELKLPRGS